VIAGAYKSAKGAAGMGAIFTPGGPVKKILEKLAITNENDYH
jgi:hypothetical protein